MSLSSSDDERELQLSHEVREGDIGGETEEVEMGVWGGRRERVGVVRGHSDSERELLSPSPDSSLSLSPSLDSSLSLSLSLDSSLSLSPSLDSSLSLTSPVRGGLRQKKEQVTSLYIVSIYTGLAKYHIDSNVYPSIPCLLLTITDSFTVLRNRHGRRGIMCCCTVNKQNRIITGV